MNGLDEVFLHSDGWWSWIMNGEQRERVTSITKHTKELVRQSKQELENFRRSQRWMEQALETSRQQLRDSLIVKYRLIYEDTDE